MEAFYIPSESDFKRWVKEAIEEYLEGAVIKDGSKENKQEPLLNRKEIAQVLRISLVTLTDWTKHGLPYHKQRGRVYFLHSEVMEYIKKNHLKKYFDIA